MRREWHLNLGSLAAFCAVSFCACSATALADDPTLPAAVTAFLDRESTNQQGDATLTSIEEKVLPTLKTLARSEVLVNALTRDNNARMVLTSMEIEGLRNRWSRAVAVRDHGILNTILKSPASAALQHFRRDAADSHELRLCLTDNRGLLTAAAQASQDYTPQSPESWRRIYLSPRGKAFIKKSETVYRIEIGVWNPAQQEAVGTLIAEITARDQVTQPVFSASAESGDYLNLR